MKNKSFMKILSALLAVVMVLCAAPLNGFVGLELPELFSIEASAVTYSGSCGTKVNWSLDTSTGVLNITGTGAMKDYSYSSSAPWYSYRSYVKSVNIQNGVTSIGSYAFYNCTSLTSVTIPDSVTSIGYDAFYDCTSLTSVTIPDSVESIGSSAFEYCTSLTSVTIPDSVTSIDHHAFRYCTSLTTVTIGDSVESIGSYAFYNCTSLTSVTIGDSVESIGSYAFSGCTSLTPVTIPDSVTSIGSSAFEYCYRLRYVVYSGTSSDWSKISIGSNNTYLTDATKIAPSALNNKDDFLYVVINGKAEILNYTGSSSSVIIPSEIGGIPVASIGDYAFYKCTSLTSVTIGDSVESIGSYAFYNCTSLTSVTIGDSVESIGSCAFYNCTSLTSVIIPDSVTSIGSSAFYGCTGLKELTMPASAKIYNGTFYNCTNIEKVTLIKGTGTMQSYYRDSGYSDTYYQYTPWYISRNKIKEIVIEDGVTNIGSYAFYGCTGLTSVTIPDSVISIGSTAFYKCTSLTSVTIGDSVTSIGSNAFENCTSLARVYYNGDIESWCNIDFANDYSNPLCYGHNFYINNELVKEVIIPDGSEEIKPRVFYNYDKLESVTIPVEVITIHKNAFYSCDGIETVYYEGTEDEWDEIVIYNGNDALDIGKKEFNTDRYENDPGENPDNPGETPDVPGVNPGDDPNANIFLSGAITSFGDGTTEIILKKKGVTETYYTAVVLATDNAYSLHDTEGKIEPGEYVLSVSKKNHVTREYDVVISEEPVVLDIKLNLIGDISGDGKITITDYINVLKHVKKTVFLEDYIFKCADVDNNGKLTVSDYARLLRHIKKTDLLW